MNIKKHFLICGIMTLFFSACQTGQNTTSNALGDAPHLDTPFVQEYHEAYIPDENPAAKDVRGIAVDSASNVWIATAAGVFVKPHGENHWDKIIKGVARGPAFSVAVTPGAVWLGTWDGVYAFAGNELKKHTAVSSPISVICPTPEGVYCLGPGGVWRFRNGDWKKLNYPIAQSVRDAVTDGQGGLWVATDVGLYHCNSTGTTLFQDEQALISSYLRGLASDADKNLWCGGLGGVTIRQGRQRLKTLTTETGLPSAEVRSVACSPEGVLWVGTDIGVVRFFPDGRHSLRFSRRWLVADRVNAVAFDPAGNAWIATDGGVSAIKRREMTLSTKADYFYRVLMQRHIREPWIAGSCRLDAPGDTAAWHPEDDDNDGEYTGIYLAMESLRYAVTHSEDAREKAGKAFAFLKYLREVTETDGFFARTIVPADWVRVHDGNRNYTEKELAEARVRDPRYKPVETRWHLSKDRKWLWKGDTSSDEMCGHFMGYFYYYEFAADETERAAIARHVQKILDYLIEYHYNFVDVDGQPTRWAVWSPEKLNGEPDWAQERSLNSFELLAFLKFAYHISGDEKYQHEYRRLIEAEQYLENAAQLNRKNPAWFIYFDVSLAGYLFPILLKYEQDPKLREFYGQLIDEWFEKQIHDESPLNNFIYCFARNRLAQVAPSLNFLIETPLDLVDWHIDHSKREDIQLVRRPTLDELQTHVLVAPSLRPTVRWDRNPWAATNGDPRREREPVFWLFPYWLGRHIGAIADSLYPPDKTVAGAGIGTLP